MKIIKTETNNDETIKPNDPSRSNGINGIIPIPI